MSMEYRAIDLEHWPRREHFAYFSTMADPYVGVTAEVDITGFLSACRGAGLPFFLSFLYCAGRAANAVPQLRQRIIDGAPVEFDRCDTSHTVLREDGTYSYCRLDCMRPFARYLPDAAALQREARERGGLDDGEDAASLLFVSTLPWVRYTAIRQPVPSPADSNPRLTWGRFLEQGGRASMPVTVLANHALVDGVHIGAFFQALERETGALAAQVRQGPRNETALRPVD